MEFTVNVTLDQSTLDQLTRIEDAIHQLQQGAQQMALDLSRLTDDVGATRTVEDSSAALIQQIVDELRASAGDQAAINMLADSLEEGKTNLGNAVAANTPTSNGGGGQPVPFATKVDGESFVDYQTRLFTYNSQVPIDQQAPTLSEDEWNAAPVG
jgi:hypothetical protein